MQNKGIKLKQNNHDKKVMPKECKAAIVTCGGLCPGLNSVIREVVTKGFSNNKSNNNNDNNELVVVASSIIS